MGEAYFRRKIMDWSASYNRAMPWKGEKNPYLIWLSEIILQQTRVEQGLPYFLTFKKKFPTVFDLAKAPLDDILLAWEGLGYYSRARNLHATAKNIVENYGGNFPNTYDEIIKLKGIGAYTAAAISSFAFDEPRAVVDGNVIRVLSRFKNEATPYDTTLGRKVFQQLADQFLDEKNPAKYNQAIMDFGAIICTPNNPQCGTCVVAKKCESFTKKNVESLPKRLKKISIKKRFFIYFILKKDNKIAICKRAEKDIWQDLYQFPMVELAEEFELKHIIEVAKKKLGYAIKGDFVGSDSQLLSHQKINCFFVNIENSSAFEKKNKEQANWIWVDERELQKFAMPKIINLFVKKNSVI